MQRPLSTADIDSTKCLRSTNGAPLCGRQEGMLMDPCDDLYGMDDGVVDLYRAFPIHRQYVVAHDDERRALLTALIEQGAAERLTGGDVVLTAAAVAQLKEMAGRRGVSLNPFSAHRRSRPLVRMLLHEWEAEG